MKSVIAALVLAGGILVSPGSAASAPQKGQPVPQFRVVSSSGQQITYQNYRGKLLVVEFFATWCNPCRNSIPYLVGLAQTYASQGVSVIGISMDSDDERRVREFIAETKINYPVVPAGEEAGSAFGVRSVPTIFLIDKQGIIVEKFMGFNEHVAQRLDATIKKLLSE